MKVELNNINKTYGSVTALDGVSFDIPAGTTFGVLGTNGAGKTTLFELLVGHDTPDEGHITVGGTDVATAGASVRERIGFLPEQVGFPGQLTGREVLEVHARIRGLGGEQASRIDEVLETVDLADAADRRVSGYSNGMGTRLGLAAALLAEPPILVLDEPTAGLDPRGVEAFHRLIERIDRERDATVILSSHALAEVDRLCSHVAILDDGQLCAVDAVDRLGRANGAAATVSITPVDDDASARVVEAAQPFGEVTVGIDMVTVACDPAETLALLGRLDQSWLAGLEVNEPGLDAAFHDAIEGPGEVVSP